MGSRLAVRDLGAAGGWRDVRAPLRVVTSLAARGSTVLAVGYDRSCRAAGARSDDGGASWRAFGVPSGTLSVAAGVRGPWLLRREGNAAGVLRAAGSGLLALTVPCDNARDYGPKALAVAGDTPYLVCEGPDGQDRTLLSGRFAGADWLRVADFSSRGFAGRGRAQALVFGGRGAGWLLLAGSDRCPEGELRASTDGGATWTLLPCPSRFAPVGQVLDVAFGADGTGVLVARGAGGLVTLTSADGGRSWRR